jgi:chemotaxis protein methyltransferase CheR
VRFSAPVLEKAELTDADLTKISRLIHSKCGIRLSEGKEALVRSRLEKKIRDSKFGSFHNYYQHVVKDTTSEELIQLLDFVSTNFTSFFREEQHFDFLRSELLPELARTKQHQENKLRFWSAGCSTGEEAYSITITLLEAIKNSSMWDLSILATDISSRALSVAESGVFHKDRVHAISSETLKTYFLKGDGNWKNYVKIKDSIKRHMRFERLNLIDPFSFNEPFDCIFCRNVMMYFDQKMRSNLVNRFYECLARGGALIIGHSENLTGLQHAFRYVKPAVYRK